MSRILLLTLLVASPVAVLAESAMPSIGFTGAPTDHNGQNCSTCHNSFGPAVNNSAALTANITSYNPGAQQTIQIIIQSPQAQRWGFQITIRSVSSSEMQSAGDFSAGISVQVACDDGSRFGSAPPCNGINQFGEHSNAPRAATGTAFEFDVPWTPPASEIGDLRVYI